MSLTRQLVGLLAHAPTLLPTGAGVLVAASGGADSTALVRLLAELQPAFGWRLDLAHAQFGLRGDDSDGDERFVCELAERLGLPVHVARFDLSARTGGIEADARALRYCWFARLADERGLNRVATGHHADDQAETVLFRLLRGNGIGSLSAMQPDRPLREDRPDVRLVRPLLTVSKAELTAYLAHIGQPYRTDRTNLDPEIATRNWLRCTILPAARSQFARVDEHLTALGREAAALTELAERWLADETARRRDRLPTDLPALADVPAWRIADLSAHSPTVRAALLRHLAGSLSADDTRKLDDLTVQRRVSSVALGDGRTGVVWANRLALIDPATLTALAPTDPIPLATGESVTIAGQTIRLDDDAPDGLRLRRVATSDTISPRPGARARPVSAWLKQRQMPEVFRLVWPVVALDSAVVWLPGLGWAGAPSYLHVSSAHFPNPNPVAR